MHPRTVAKAIKITRAIMNLWPKRGQSQAFYSVVTALQSFKVGAEVLTQH
jgi:hypothetical protein